MIRIGTAGWTIPSRFATSFPELGSSLERYAARFTAVEINSSFHRPHKPETYVRWAETVPDGFRFAVKLPKTITHERRLVDTAKLLDPFLDSIRLLGSKLGPLLVQLPPSLVFEAGVAAGFFGLLRTRIEASVACEPRHPSWFEAEAASLMTEYRVARVAADPARVPAAALRGGWPGLVYVRLHGSPRIYYSEYGPEWLADAAARLGASTAQTWCMFDNTASGAAIGNALDVQERMRARQQASA